MVDCKRKSDILKVVFIILGNGGYKHEKEDYLRSTYWSNRGNLCCTGICMHAANQNRHELEERLRPHDCEYQAERHHDSEFYDFGQLFPEYQD